MPLEIETIIKTGFDTRLGYKVKADATGSPDLCFFLFDSARQRWENQCEPHVAVDEVEMTNVLRGLAARGFLMAFACCCSNCQPTTSKAAEEWFVKTGRLDGLTHGYAPACYATEQHRIDQLVRDTVR